MKKIIVFFLFLIILFNFSESILGAIDQTIQPYYNNAGNVTAGFSINPFGKAIVSLFCQGTPGVMTKVRAITYVEKKFLFFFWTRVDIGQANNEWNDEALGSNFAKEHSVQLKEKGTYRAVIEFTVSGTGGTADNIPFTIEAIY